MRRDHNWRKYGAENETEYSHPDGELQPLGCVALCRVEEGGAVHADGVEERDYDGEDVHAADVGGYFFDPNNVVC